MLIYTRCVPGTEYSLDYMGDMTDEGLDEASEIFVLAPQNTEATLLELFCEDDGLPIADPSTIRQRKVLYFGSRS